MDDKQPLWLPAGSVRAMLALGIEAVIWGRYAITGTLPDQALLGIATLVLGAYGIARAIEQRQNGGQP